MRAALDPEARRLTLVFEKRQSARDYLAEVRAAGGLQVELERRLSQYDVVTLIAELEGRSEEVLECYAARITENSESRFDTAFVVREWVGRSDEELFDRLTAPIRDSPASSGGGEPSRGEVQGSAAIYHVQKLNVSQRAIRAQRADRAERQVLLRDNAPQVLQGLLTNPRVEAKEILRIAKSTFATGAILQRLAGDARWSKNPEVLAAIVRNPKSPTLVVTRLVDKLRTSDLRKMAKMSSGLKEAVRKAALREYMKRSGQ